MGMFHLEMAAMALVFKTHFKEMQDIGSLSFWVEELGRDANKLWNDHDSTKVKDFNQCQDFFDTILDGYLLSIICRFFCPGSRDVNTFHTSLPGMDAAALEAGIQELAERFINFNITPAFRNPEGGDDRDYAYENMMLFAQHGLLLRTFRRAVKTGDAGLMLNALSIITLWFQGSSNNLYASECLRLTANLREIWPEDLVNHWMENCLVNLSGKRKGFMTLDGLNEHIIRELKDTAPENVTEASLQQWRLVRSPLIMLLSALKKIVAGQFEGNIFDFHSSSVSAWPDITVVANKMLSENHVEFCNNRLNQCNDAVGAYTLPAYARWAYARRLQN